MKTQLIDPTDIVKLGVPNYTHGIVVDGAKTWVLLSGQIGVDADGNAAKGAEAQCRQAFDNIKACLRDADMTIDDVVMLRIFLTNREDLPAFRAARQEAIGDRCIPSTMLFISGLVHPDWRVELEVTAAKE
ncbi:MAG: RidA family protein [Rhodospirillaceae bacterium]|nr:RidA family protein [Rhodospirillaceae bacterium]